MGIYVNPNNKYFKEIKRSKPFVDKSELLNLTNNFIDTKWKLCCVSSPRRFGKSTNAAMISAYYSRGCDSSTLFQDLKIAQFPDYTTHMNKYHLIYLDIAEFHSTYVASRKDDTTLAGFINHIQRIILLELSEVFPDVISFPDGLHIIDENMNLSRAIKKINFSKEVRFVFVIDEWDCLFRTEKNNLKLQDDYIELLQSIFKGNVSEQCIHLAYMTGILPIKKYGTHSALNNFKEYSMTQPRMLAPYIGFSEVEVQTLCENYNMDLQIIKQWYEGYNLPGVGPVYNPNSVVEALVSGVVDNYWCKTESFEALRQYIDLNFDGLREAVVSLVAGESVSVATGAFLNDMVSVSSRDDVLTLLVHLGYLVYQKDSSESSFGKVKIPNREIRDQFQTTIRTGNWNKLSKILEQSEEILTATWNMDGQEVSKRIEQIHEDFSSLYDYNNEDSLRCIIQLAYYTAQIHYTIFHELPTGKGRADVTFLPTPASGKIPLLIELKYNRSSYSAIKQIKSKNYVGKLKAYPEVLLVGINYSKKTKRHTCKIEKWSF